jgi:hypothetical protein
MDRDGAPLAATWDGARWRSDDDVLRIPVAGAVAAAHLATGAPVVFGGFDADNALVDHTQVLNPATRGWELRASSSLAGPPALRRAASSAFDAATMFVVGGVRSNGTPSDELWRWSDGHFNLLRRLDEPVADAALACPGVGLCWLIGGTTGNVLLARYLVLGKLGSTVGGGAFPPTAGAAAAFAPDAEGIVTFGGETGGPRSAQTCFLPLNLSAEPECYDAAAGGSPGVNPGAAVHASMTTHQGRALLYANNAFFFFAGRDLGWAALESPPGKPRPSERSGALFWSDGERVWLFGGFSSLGAPLDELWSGRVQSDTIDDFVLHAPTDPFSDGGPLPRQRAAGAYLPGEGRAVVFGGQSGVGASASSLGDTWELDARERPAAIVFHAALAPASIRGAPDSVRFEVQRAPAGPLDQFLLWTFSSSWSRIGEGNGARIVGVVDGRLPQQSGALRQVSFAVSTAKGTPGEQVSVDSVLLRVRYRP